MIDVIFDDFYLIFDDFYLIIDIIVNFLVDFFDGAKYFYYYYVLIDHFI